MHLSPTQAARKLSVDVRQLETLERREKQALASGAPDQFISAVDEKKARARRLLPTAEYAMNLKTINTDRKLVGLRPLSKKPVPPKSGADALAAARSVLGRNISSLKYSGPLARYLDKWPGNDVCCANFASACLQKAGLIKGREHNDAVSSLAENLSRDRNWNRVGSLRHAKPGDVVCFNVPGEGPMSHVELFEGWSHGEPRFIGSNNVNPDGSQRISQGTVGYPIGAIYHYRG